MHFCVLSLVGESVQMPCELYEKIVSGLVGRDIAYAVAPRYAGDPAVLVASSEHARRVLGWNPVYGDLNRILETAWNWHQNPRF